MNRDEFAMRIKEEAMDIIYQVIDEVKTRVSPEGILWDAIDDIEGEYIRWIDEMPTQELIEKRHDLSKVDFIGGKLRTEILSRLF